MVTKTKKQQSAVALRAHVCSTVVYETETHKRDCRFLLGFTLQSQRAFSAFCFWRTRKVLQFLQHIDFWGLRLRTVVVRALIIYALRMSGARKSRVILVRQA